MRPVSKAAYARLMVLKYVVVHAISTPKPILAELFARWAEKERREFDEGSRERAEAMVAKMKAYGLWKHASPLEKEFLQSYGSQMDEYAHKAAAWRVECAAILMWALGLLSKYPEIDQPAEVDLLKSVPTEKVGFFSRCPSLRPAHDLSAKRNLLELWHWRVRTRQLIEEGRPLNPDDAMKSAGFHSYDDIVRFSAKAGCEQGDLPEIKDEDFVFLGRAFRDLPSDEYRMATSIIMERHYAINWLCGMAPGNRWDETPTDT